MKSTRRNLLLGAAACVAWIAAAAQPAQAADLEKLRALIPVRLIDEAFSPFVVAKHMGYFEAEGLDVELLAAGGSNEVAIQIAAGNGDVGAASPGQALIGMQSGFNMPVQYYYNLYYQNIWSISVLPESPIKAVTELKGKKLGVASLGSAGLTFGRAFLAKAGLNPDSDANFLAIGAGAQAMTSLRQGAVDAMVFWDAALAKFEVNGMKTRELPVDPDLLTLPDVSLIVQPDRLKAKAKQLEGFARAVSKGYDFTMANPAAAVAITWKYYPAARPKAETPAAAMEEGIKVNQRRMAIWSSPKTNGQNGLFIEQDWMRLVDFMIQQRLMTEKLKPARIFTNEMIPAINKYDRAALIASAKTVDPASIK